MQQLSEVENTQLGVAAGVIEVTAMQSVNYLKNASQQYVCHASVAVPRWPCLTDKTPSVVVRLSLAYGPAIESQR
jgi:hypothetical protein